MKTIQRDNKNYIEGKIVMLPSANWSPIVNSTSIYGGLFHSEYYSPMKEMGDSYQHLYLICDLPIEEDDWFIRNNELQQCFKIHTTEIEFKTKINSVYCGKNTFWNKEYCKKVIAATDKELSVDIRKPLGIFMELPDFNQSFIKEFVERKGKDVDVLVEVEKYTETIYAMGIDCSIELCKIKLNPDNTVNLIFK